MYSIDGTFSIRCTRVFSYSCCNESNVCPDSLMVPPGTSISRKDSTRKGGVVKTTGILLVKSQHEFFSTNNY